MIFVDTNYFVRLIENDAESQAAEVKELFLLGLSGKSELCSSIIVLFEIYWLMKSFYGKNGRDLQEILWRLVNMDYVKWESQKILAAAIERMDKFGFDLEDSYNCAYAKYCNVSKIASFDKKLQKSWGRK